MNFSSRILLLLAVFQTVQLVNTSEILREKIELHAESPNFEHQRKGPTVGNVDRLCPASSIQGNTCTIQAKDIRLTYDFVYTTSLNLVFDNTIVQCVTTSYIPCALQLTVNGTRTLVMKNGSKMIGKQIIVNATQSQIIIMDTSSLSVTGQSLNQNGTQVRPQDGAQFVGQGGSCNVTQENYTTFGNFDMLPDFTKLLAFINQMGSMGQPGDAETSGGGRMVLLADSFNLTGWGAALQANALPSYSSAKQAPYPLVGGSGGYMYILSYNLFGQNFIGPNITIEAQGGYGKNEYYGGSGGVIIFDGNMEVNSDQVTTAGGQAINSVLNTNGCGNGAAGTQYYRNQSILIIDNEGLPTVKRTVLTARPPVALNNPSKIADSVFIDGGAQVWIDSQQSSWLQFSDLEMLDNVTVGLITSNANPFTLSIGDSNMAPSSSFDFSRIWLVNLNISNYQNILSVGSITYGRVLKFNGGQVTIGGNVSLSNPQDTLVAPNSMVYFDVFSLALMDGSSISSGKIFSHSRGATTIQNNVNITSYINNTCSTNLSTVPKMFTCVPFNSMQKDISQSTFIQQYNQQYASNAVQLFDTVRNISQAFIIYFISEVRINMKGANIQGPRIGLCAPDISMISTKLDASEKGCQAGQGIGKGLAPSNCSGSGGSHAGQGGYGLPLGNKLSCLDNAPLPYSFQPQAIYEGSSGGSAVINTQQGGNGGGIIWLSAIHTIQMNQSSISVDGQNGVESAQYKKGSGGGAGGSIQIITKNIEGQNSTISSQGGNGSIYGGGGGAGGRVVTQLLQSYNATNSINQSLGWNGTILINGGIGGFVQPINNTQSTQNQKILTGGAGQPGTTTQSSCFGGFSGPFCKPCPIGMFKYDFNTAVCQPCSNKPSNSFYNQIAQSSAQCSYQCVEGLETVDVNPKCLNSLDLQVQRVGGTKGTLLVILTFFILSLFLWIIISIRSNQIQAKNKDLYATVYDGVLFTESDQDQDVSETIVGPTSLHMRDSDIWSHTHRMYLIGENSISYPWFMTKDFPTNALTELGKERMLRFIKKEQWTLDWSSCQTYCYFFFKIFFPYMADLVHRSIRRKHFRMAEEKLFQQFEQSDWEDITGRTVRLSADADSRLAYVDFLDYRRNKGNYKGPKLPMTLLLAGNGTLSTPYKFNFLNDPLAKSLVYLNKDLLKQKLPAFFQNLNTLLDKLCFYKFNRQTMKDLTDVIEWIELGNKTLFAPLDVKICFYVFENSYQEIAGGSFRQRRRSMPLESQVFEAFPVLFKRLIQHVQLKLLTKHAEIKLGIVVKSTNPAHEARITQKIRQISESLGGQNENLLQFHKTSVSSLYEEEEFLRTTDYQKPKKGSLKDARRDNNLSENLISESDMEVSQVMIHGTDITEEVRIIDKSKRAFDISVESTKALELVLQKDRKRCKHNCARMKSVLYSLWILFFKLHGRPPSQSISLWFLLFSMSLAIEFLFTTIFLLYIVSPVRNIWTLGFPFLFVLPALTIVAPLWGLLGTFIGSTTMLKSYSTMNATMIVLNYPLTIFALWVYGSQQVYISVLIILMLNKILLSLFGSKVRQHFANPGFAKTQLKLTQQLSELLIADKTGRSHGLTTAQRAAMLVSSGQPGLIGDFDERNDSNIHVVEEIDHLDDGEDEDSFGIVATKKLRQGSIDSSKITNLYEDDKLQSNVSIDQASKSESLTNHDLFSLVSQAAHVKEENVSNLKEIVDDDTFAQSQE